MAEKVFGSWPRAEVPPWKPVDPPPPTRRLVIVDKPDAVQTEIRVGQIAIPRKHSDYLAFDVAVKILGGEGANRLHRVLRSERGLTYGAEADMQAIQAGRRLHRGNQHPHGDDGRDAAAHASKRSPSCSGSACSNESCRTRRRIWPAAFR